MSGVKHDSVDDKDFASPKNKKLKLHDDQDLGDNSHHLPVPMYCDDDPKVAKNDNSLKPNADLFSKDRAQTLFARWCSEFGRIYYTQEEYNHRFNCFKENLESVTHLQNQGFPCGLNGFADWTDEEMLKLFCRYSDSESDTEQDHIQERHADKSFVSEKALDYDDDTSDYDDDVFG